MAKVLAGLVRIGTVHTILSVVTSTSTKAVHLLVETLPEKLITTAFPTEGSHLACNISFDNISVSDGK